MKILDPYIREILDNSINTSTDLKDFKEYVNPKLSDIAERIDFFEQSINKLNEMLRLLKLRLSQLELTVEDQKEGIMQNYDEDEEVIKRVEKIERILNI